MNERKFTTKKAAAVFLALIFGTVLAILFPLPRSPDPAPIVGGSVKAPNWPRAQADQKKPIESHRVPRRYVPGPPHLWACDPIDSDTVFGNTKEVVETFGAEEPYSLGFKKCFGLRSNPYGQEGYPQ
jgi:hypothetical protein